MRRISLVGTALSLLAVADPARAEVPSIIGGKLLPPGTSGHHFGVGLPSLFYEWWNGGDQMDWALHVGMVYDDWPASINRFDDVQIGLDLEAPMRFHLAHSGKADVAFRFAPGFLLADAAGDTLVLGLKPEVGVLVGIQLSEMVNLVTGGVVPFTVLIVPDAVNVLVVPILPRLGVEVQPTESLVTWALMEIGPTVLHADGYTDTRAGVRFWIGITWYP
jgi:hypothetical protein